MRYSPVNGTLFPTLLLAGATIGASGILQRTESGKQETTNGWLGVALSCSGCDGRGDKGPLIVRAVAPGGPAERVLSVGDTIVSVNRTITDPQRMRDALSATPRDSLIAFEMHGARGRYSVTLRKRADRMARVGRDSLPLRYQGVFAGVGVEVLTGAAPVVSRDSTGAMVIRIGDHAVRLNAAAANAR